MKEVLL